MDIIGIKIGGSVITRKNCTDFPTDFSEISMRCMNFIYEDRVKKVANVISRYHGKSKLFVVNGAGPFGHSLVGRADARVIHSSVSCLNRVVREEFEKRGVVLSPVAPYDFCWFVKGKPVVEPLVDQVVALLMKGEIPVSFGDMAPHKDENGRFSVISGDKILPSVGLDPRVDMKKMIMISEHQLHDRDVNDPKARPINKVVVDNHSFDEKMEQMGISFAHSKADHSKSMEGKARACFEFTQVSGNPSLIVPYKMIDRMFDDNVGTVFSKE